MKKHSHLVAIIIPAWNNWDLTQDCLRSILSNTKDISYQVILVDNGSTDPTTTNAEALGHALFGEHFHYERLPENKGFAKACNRGAQKASAKYLFFLNNDTRTTPNWLPPLLTAMQEDTRIAGVGPLLLFPQSDALRAKRVQHLGIASSHGPDFRHLYELFPATHPVVRTRRKLGVITAAALLIPSALFLRDCGFYEHFINGMEDVDFCCRIVARGGYFSVIPESVMYHHTNATTGRFDHEADNLKLLLQRCRNVQEDFCAHIIVDGFEPAFTPWLDLVPRMPKAHAQDITRTHEKRLDCACLYEQLQKNPLWDQGYTFLIRELIATDHAGEALPVAYLRTLLCPSLPAFEEYAELLAGFGRSALAQKTAAMVQAIKSTLAAPHELTAKALKIQKTTRDAAVIQALGTWRDNYCNS